MALPLSSKFNIAPDTEVSILTPTGSGETRTIGSSRKHNRFLIISLKGVNLPEVASSYRGASICISRESLPRDKDEFFYDEVIGLSVVTIDGMSIGRVEEIFETAANDVYVVRKDGREHLLPAIRDVIHEIDLGAGRIVIKNMPGLLD